MLRQNYVMKKLINSRKLISIVRLLVVLFVVMSWGITSFNSPAYAASNQTDKPAPSPVAQIASIGNRSIFTNPSKVYLGITPTGWVNDDDPTIDDNIPFKQIVSEAALAGFQGTSVGHKYPEDINVLKSELNLRHLKISEPWVGTKFTVPGEAANTLKTFEEQSKFIKEMGGTDIVVAELGYAVHQEPIAPLPNKPKFTDEQWRELTKGLNQLGKLAADKGMQLCYHPHVGTGVETLDEIDRLMDNTDPKYVKLLLDTGHLYYAGVDPLEVTQKYAKRIKHVHLKNIRQSVLDDSIQKNLSFLASIRAGVFTVPGDPNGAINFQPILKELANANYQGWLVVEAEQDPKKANPLLYASMARNYINEITGL